MKRTTILLFHEYPYRESNPALTTENRPYLPIYYRAIFAYLWRRDRDSNPGHLAALQFSRLLASSTRAPRHFQLLHRVPPAGIEPATRRLKVGCSNQLSYRGFSSPGPLARAHERNASGGTIRAAVCEGIQRPACLHYHPRSPSTRPASHIRLTRQTRQQTRVLTVQPRVTVDDNALWAR